MQIIYSHTKLNFGDDLNLWLWPKLMHSCLQHDDNILFLGIGTIVSSDFYRKHLSGANKILLFSSGAGDKPVPVIDEQWKVYCVRGPRTAKKLEVSKDLAIADGAYLLRILNIFRPGKKAEIAFIPHHRSEDYINWETICKKANVTYISPKQPVDAFLSKIQTCKKVMTEAMHGAIVADALRIPWVPARFAPNFLEEKWLDFFESIKISPSIRELPIMYQKRQRTWRLFRNFVKQTISKIAPTSGKWQNLPVSGQLATDSDLKYLISELKTIAYESAPVLSDDKVVEDITSKLKDKIEQLRDDYLSGTFGQ